MAKSLRLLASRYELRPLVVQLVAVRMAICAKRRCDLQMVPMIPNRRLAAAAAATSVAAAVAVGGVASHPVGPSPLRTGALSHLAVVAAAVAMAVSPLRLAASAWDWVKESEKAPPPSPHHPSRPPHLRRLPHHHHHLC